MKTIIFANQKGGVLKTTSTYTVADALTDRGYKVLMVDMDSQCNLSVSFDIDADKCKYTCQNLIDRQATLVPISDIVVKTRAGDLIPGSSGFQTADRIAQEDQSAFMLLKKALKIVSDNYDFCLIDVPPQLTFLFFTSFYAADWIVAPVDVSAFSQKSFVDLTEKIVTLKEDLNPDVKVAGLLLTKVNDRTLDFSETRKEYSEMATMLGTKVFDNYIPNSTKMALTVKKNTSIFQLAPESSVAKAYNKFTDELLNTIGE